MNFFLHTGSPKLRLVKAENEIETKVNLADCHNHLMYVMNYFKGVSSQSIMAKHPSMNSNMKCLRVNKNSGKGKELITLCLTSDIDFCENNGVSDTDSSVK